MLESFLLMLKPEEVHSYRNLTEKILIGEILETYDLIMFREAAGAQTTCWPGVDLVRYAAGLYDPGGVSLKNLECFIIHSLEKSGMFHYTFLRKV